MFNHCTGPLRVLTNRLFSHSVLPSSKEKWNLVTSVCVQRKPIVVKEMTDIEKKMYNLLSVIEKENSLKSDWELQCEEDLLDLEKIKAGDIDKVGKKLRSDLEDDWKAEFNTFKLASHKTKDDELNNVKSIDRCLRSSLILVVQQQQNGNRWILPQGNHVPGETLRQTAERVLMELCGSDLKVRFYGNAPCGFFKYKYPKSIREKLGIVGDKVFFFKAFLLSGQMKSSSEVNDFQWIDRQDLRRTVSGDYAESVEMFLF